MKGPTYILCRIVKKAKKSLNRIDDLATEWTNSHWAGREIGKQALHFCNFLSTICICYQKKALSSCICCSRTNVNNDQLSFDLVQVRVVLLVCQQNCKQSNFAEKIKVGNINTNPEEMIRRIIYNHAKS